MTRNSCCAGLATRRGYDPVEQRRLTKGGDLHAIPMPVAPSKLSTPRAGMSSLIVCFASRPRRGI